MFSDLKSKAKKGAAGKMRAYKRGGVTPASAVHKHERNMHKGEPLTKFASGGAVEGEGSKSRLDRKGRGGKGKTTVNVIVASGQSEPKPVPVPMPPGPPAGGPPMPPPGMGAGPGPMPPPGMKRGGRTGINLPGGAGGGAARLKQEKHYRGKPGMKPRA